MSSRFLLDFFSDSKASIFMAAFLIGPLRVVVVEIVVFVVVDVVFVSKVVVVDIVIVFVVVVVNADKKFTRLIVVVVNMFLFGICRLRRTCQSIWFKLTSLK